ncbi:MAG: L-threonylcarbamoyladenylate synthase [Balneola sp.]
MHIASKYIQAIKNGEVVAFPTETVYGLGADAWNPEAIAKVFETKGRPSDNPLIVHISDFDQVNKFAAEVPEVAQLLIEEFWPGPLTLVFKKKPEVLDVVTSGLTTVAIRMPANDIAISLISGTNPLVAPSANRSGAPSPTKASHVMADFGSSVLVIDGGSTQVGLESTVLDISGDQPMILRPGVIGKDQLEKVLNQTVLIDDKSSEKPKSPGQKYSHYKPKAEVKWLDSEDEFEDTSSLFLLLNAETEQQNIINYTQDFEKLARELYDRFRQADIDGYKKVIIEPFDERYDSSVIPALLNRIEKATSL